MEQRLILAAVLIPALVWPACNGGTENLGDDGDGGSAGANLESNTSGPTSGDPETTGTLTSTASAANGAGGALTSTASAAAEAANSAGGATSTTSAAMGAGGAVTSTASAANGAGGGVTSTASAAIGAGGFGTDGSLPDSTGFGAGGGSGGVTTGTAGPVGAGGMGAGGTNQTYAGANALYDSSTRVGTLINDAEQLYAGGSVLAAIPMPNGPANGLGTGSAELRLAIDATHLYVCSAGSLYRMSKNGGGTQNFQGAGVDAAYACRAVSVDDAMVHAAWFDAATNRVVVRSWTKTDRTAPADGLVLEDVSDAYLPHLIANDALYYADRTDEELLLGRIALDDYTDETLLSVDAEFDSEYLVPLAAKGNDLYFQSCEQIDSWCSLFVQEGAGNEPVPYEQFQRDSVIESLAVADAAVVVALAEGIHSLETTEAGLEPLWIHPSMVSYGPLLAVGNELYFASDPVYGSGSIVWHLPLIIPTL